MHARIGILKQTTEGMEMGNQAQNAQTFVDLLKEVAKALTNGESIGRIGCPVIPDKVLHEIQQGIMHIDPKWIPPPPTEPLKDITQIVNILTRVQLTADKVRNEENVTTAEIRPVIERFKNHFRWEGMQRSKRGKNIQGGRFTKARIEAKYSSNQRRSTNISRKRRNGDLHKVGSHGRQSAQ